MFLGFPPPDNALRNLCTRLKGIGTKNKYLLTDAQFTLCEKTESIMETLLHNHSQMLSNVVEVVSPRCILTT